MKTFWKRYAATAALAVGLLAVGCDQAGDPASPIAPEEQAQDGLIGDVVDGLGGLEFVRSNIYQLQQQVVTTLIDPALGGELNLLGHKLTIPAGAVEAPTFFVMFVIPGNTIQVELFAIDARTGINVGEQGFQIPVQLSLSYATADVDDPENLIIVHVERNGNRIPLPSTVDEDAELVSADLAHFSRYAMCSN